MGYTLQSLREHLSISQPGPVPEKNVQIFNAFLKANKLGPSVLEDGGKEEIITEGRHSTEKTLY